MRRTAIVALILLLAGSGLLSAQEPQTNKAQKGKVAPREEQPNAVLCAVYPPKLPLGTKPAGMVIHLYGRRGSHTAYNLGRPPYAILRQLLPERGYWIVVPELGGDHWMNDKAVKTLDAIIAGMIAAEGIDPARVHILGNSMGAGSGLIYVSQRPGVIRSICAMYPMTDFNAWLREKPDYANSVAGAYDRDPTKLQSILAQRSPMQNIDAFATVPVMLLHGDADSAVPVHHSRDFAAALSAKGYAVTYHEAPGFNHEDALAENYQMEIADFLTGKTDHDPAESEKLPGPNSKLTVDLGGGGATTELLLIRSGSLTTGSQRNTDEQPAQRGAITKPFSIGKNLIKPEQWHYCGLADGWSLYTNIGGGPRPGEAASTKKGKPATAEQPGQGKKPAVPVANAKVGKTANTPDLQGRVVAVWDDGKTIALEVTHKGSQATTHTARIDDDTKLNYNGVQTGEHQPTVGLLAQVWFSKNQPEAVTAVRFITKKVKTVRPNPDGNPPAKKPAPDTTGKSALERKTKKQPAVAP